MSVQHDEISSGRRALTGASSESDSDQPTASCSCTSTSLPSPTGEVIVLRVAGEVDLDSLPVLRAALAGVLDRRSDHVVVDLLDLGFCSVSGLALLAGTGATAAAQGTEYAIGAASRAVNRVWALGWTDAELPIRFPTAGDGVLAALAHQAGPTGHVDGQGSSRGENHFGNAASTAGAGTVSGVAPDPR